MSWLRKVLRRPSQPKAARQKWFIAVKLRNGSPFDLQGLQPIPCPNGRYMADPFLVEVRGDHWLFYEDYDYVKGRIAVGRLEGTKLVDQRICLETENHLSFPCVLAEKGQHYMVPEQAASKELWVWRADTFPDRWLRYACVARGRFHDPVLRVAGQGVIELWATTNDDALCVFRADAMEGPWHLVSRRARISEWTRSAGLWFEGFRPVQETAPVYGRAIHVLDSNGTRVHTIEPDWHPGLNGTHTINVNDRYIVIDGRVPLGAES